MVFKSEFLYIIMIKLILVSKNEKLTIIKI